MRFFSLAMVVGSLVLLAWAGRASAAALNKTLAGSFTYGFSGYELVTPAESSTLRLDLKGIGAVTADGQGHLNGNVTFTATDPELPPAPATTLGAVCEGNLVGSYGFNGDGSGVITLNFSPTSPPASGVGAQNACVISVTALNCEVVLPAVRPQTKALKLSAIRCVASSVSSSDTSVSINAASFTEDLERTVVLRGRGGFGR